MSTRRTPYIKADYISAKAVRAYMMAEIGDHVDPLTGEVNATSLAEDACMHFDAYNGNNIPDKFFELAELIAERHEIKTGVRAYSLRNLAGLINALESDWF